MLDGPDVRVERSRSVFHPAGGEPDQREPVSLLSAKECLPRVRSVLTSFYPLLQPVIEVV